MKNELERYEALGERIFFSGLKSSELSTLGFCLKDGKTFEDVRTAFEKGRREGLGDADAEFRAISRNLKKVLDIVS